MWRPVWERVVVECGDECVVVAAVAGGQVGQDVASGPVWGAAGGGPDGVGEAFGHGEESSSGAEHAGQGYPEGGGEVVGGEGRIGREQLCVVGRLGLGWLGRRHWGGWRAVGGDYQLMLGSGGASVR